MPKTYATTSAASPTGFLLANGTVSLTGDWNAGAFSITANSVIIGSAANAIALGSASGGNGTIYSTSHATKGKILFGTSAYDEANDRLGIGITSPTEKVHIVGGTFATGGNVMKITGTFPTVISSNTFGVDIQMTSAGSSNLVPSALRVSLLAGWTGFNSSFALYAQNQVAGTSTNEFSAAQSANYGEYIATTTGTIIGQAGYASGGNRSYGGMFRAIVSKNSATNIGVAGYALNAGSSPVQIGGYFALLNSAPTFISAALIANNGSQTSPIFLGQDNGTTKFAILDGGFVGVGQSTASALLHIAAGTATASTAPLKFTSGTNLTTAEAGAMEYNNTFHLTNSDATRRHIALAPNTTKVTAGAPYTNDGYVVVNIGGTDFKVMTTA